jgi:hypothetical protein
MRVAGRFPLHERKHAAAIEAVAVGVVTIVLALCLMRWLDNVHINTMNGLWKSLVVDEWKKNFSTASLDPSNYLYYPLLSALCRLLDWLGIQAGATWRQMAVVNTVFAGVAVASVYALVRSLTGRRDAALVAAIFHLGSAFFLSLAVSNEDIMPSYTLVLLAMVMAARWFSAPRPIHVVATAAVFTLGWLLEWRLIFPTLPPLLLALALSSGSIRRRAGLVVLFLLTMTAVTYLAVFCTRNHAGAVGLAALLWTGKGISTGWAGFSIGKLMLVPEGMGEYWLGGANATAAYMDAEWLGAFAFELLLLVTAGWFFWRHRREPRLRSAAVVFMGTLVAGEVMNAYSQPSDPQMQINVMAWMSLAVGLLAARVLEAPAARKVAAIAIVLTVLPLAYNIRAFGRSRGFDSTMTSGLHDLERLTDPARTVFVYMGFEAMVTWQSAMWTHRPPGVCDLGRAPQAVPKFKWIGLFPPIIAKPSMTDEAFLGALKTELDCAFDKGYRVIAGPVWEMPTGQLAGFMTSINAQARAPALRSFLDKYQARPIGGPILDGVGSYFEIVR